MLPMHHAAKRIKDRDDNVAVVQFLLDCNPEAEVISNDALESTQNKNIRINEEKKKSSWIRW